MQQEIDAFNEALDRPQEERARFVRKKHAGDPELIRRVLKLLDAHDRADRAGFETSPVSPLATPIATSPMPERIGPYRILEVIGEGGMGIVYSAEQREPLRRRVAIKVLKLGMDSEEVLVRFEAERQAMALMDHPSVAKALDAGVTEQGRTYFVMELVKGLPLTTYCSKNSAERLRQERDV
ncbi:MAG: protein kinase [Planctomycetota bacterium]